MNWKLLTAAAVLFAAAGTQAQVEKPVVMDEAVLSITVPDVHGFLDEFGAVAAKASPMVNGAMLKNVIGMQLGDVNLAGIPVGSGFSVVALDMTNIFAVIEVSEPQSSAYLNMAKAQGLAAAYEDGAVLAAGTAETLALGRAKAGAVKASLLANDAKVLRVSMQPNKAIERNREAIDSFMQMMPMMMGQAMMQQPGATLDSTTSVTKLLEGELRVLLSISEQCSAAELKIAPENGSLFVSKTFVPKAGTALDDLVKAPGKKEMNPRLHAGLLGQGTMLVDFHSANAEALGTFVAAESEKLVHAMNIEDVNLTELTAVMRKWLSVYSGTGCELVSFGGEGNFKVRYAMEISDEAQALEMLRTMNADMGAFLKLYENMGMPMQMDFKENVREADGIKIHQFAVKADISSMPAEQQEQMKAMGMENMVHELAIHDGIMFYAEPGAIEEVIKAVQTGTAPKAKAHSVYPAGGFYYMDMDMGEYMAFAAKSMPDDPSTVMMKQQMSTLFKGTSPITSAGFKKNGVVHWSVNIPGDLIAKYGQMIMMAQMQKMQQAPMGVPGAMPTAPVTAPPAAAPGSMEAE